MVSAGPNSASDETAEWAPTLEAAARAGFSGLIWNLGGSLFSPERRSIEDLSRLARGAGLDLIVEVDLAHFPADHPLAFSHPQAFRLSRAASDAGPVDRRPVDPRKIAPVTGQAWARVHELRFARLFEEPLKEALGELVRQGANGFRLTWPNNVDPRFLQGLIGALREQMRHLIVIGDGATGERAIGVGAAIDYLVVPYAAGGDQGSGWFEDTARLRTGARVLTEVHLGGKRLATQGPAAVLREAAAISDGIIVPLALLTRGEAVIEAAADAASLAQMVSDFVGSLTPLQGFAGAVSAILRSEAPDPRRAQKALLILTNYSDSAEPLPVLANLSPIAAAFAPFTSLTGGDGQAPLEPGEVRVLRGRRGEPVMARPRPSLEASVMPSARVAVGEVTPRVEGGRYPVKRIVGEHVSVEATIFADGHEKLAAELRWRALDEDGWRSQRMELRDNDRWSAEFPLERLGRHEFVVEGWLDRFGGFRRDFGKKVDAEVAQPVDHAEGRQLVEQAAGRSKGKLASALKGRAASLARADEEESVRLLLSKELQALMEEADDRPHRHASVAQEVDAERAEARFSSWYEIFPRSMTDDPRRHGTFADVTEHLPRIRAMGFDTLYFPPIHPIGTVNRKGPNNTLTPEPDDPGSPYAIGSAEGGHDAIHPELGTFEDFDRLVSAAADQGLEIALDFAIQAAPDHPWLQEHPGWFAWRPDGSMKYAENPPKKYQDIVNVDFYGPDAVPGLWEALRDVVLLWADHGVKTFRVDNPHTKPLPFWEWMIAEVRARHPDAIFLSEAFTRPTMMYQLAKIGFSQSYTYFTWRDRKHELIDYITELTTEQPKEFYRPHFFVNTPDINPFFLQTGGRPAHRIRAVLAATLSGLWGVYSGFELCDAAPLGPGKEEYLDSEKYQVRVRDWNAPGNIIADVTLLNRLRRANPALQTHLNTRFYTANDENIIWYGKPSPDGSEMIMVMVNLDPHNPHGCEFEVPLWEFGLGDNDSIAVEDLAAGHKFAWRGKIQRIELSPDDPYRIWRLAPQKGQT